MYRPCPKCPFRTDIPAFLSRARARQIVGEIAQDRDFPCHATIDYTDDSNGKHTSDTKTCAGFAIMAENMQRPTQMMRIAERLGMYDPSKLHRDSPTHQTPKAFIDAQRDR